MKRRILVPILLALGLVGLVLAAGRHGHRPPAPDPAVVAANPGVRQAVKAETGFSFRLLARLAPAQPRGNIFFSPFSIAQALALTLNGAGGATRQGIADTLGIGTMPTDALNRANGLLLPSLENPGSAGGTDRRQRSLDWSGPVICSQVSDPVQAVL